MGFKGIPIPMILVRDFGPYIRLGFRWEFRDMMVLGVSGVGPLSWVLGLWR